MNTARKIKDVENWKGNVSLYEMTPPFKGERFVFVSGVDSSIAHETMMFAALDADAENPKDWTALACVCNTTDHGVLMDEIGYEIE